MNPSSGAHDSADELDLLIEGELPPEAAKALHARMQNDRELLSRYLEKLRVHSLLRDRAKRTSVPKLTAPERKVVIFPRHIWAAAAAVLLGLFIWWKQAPPAQKSGVEAPVNSPAVTFNSTAVFETTSPGGFGDGSYRFGDGIAMSEGSVSIRLPNGVEAIIRSPSQFSITSESRVILANGQGWFRVPPAAKGFTVETQWFDVVDLGTEFTVGAAESEQMVQVNEGRVEVRTKASGIPVQPLVAGQTYQRIKDSVQITSGTPLAKPSVKNEKPEIVFKESLRGAPDQPFSQRKPEIGTWRVQLGNPVVASERFAAQEKETHLMGRFSRPIEANENAVILVSFKSVSPKSLFHSKGFAGVSLFDVDGEMFFLGDKYSDTNSWELVVYGRKFWAPKGDRTAYDLAVHGSEQSFTLRYRQRNGQFEVFRGWGVEGVPVTRGVTDPGLRFDGIRVANGRGGDFSFDELQVSVLKDDTQ